MTRAGKLCLNCGETYPWWRKWCRNHVWKVLLTRLSESTMGESKRRSGAER